MLRMSVSVRDSDWNFEPIEITNASQLKEVILSQTYSFGVFENNHRKNDNFTFAQAIGLDVDESMTLEDAKVIFANYKHIIAPTRHHQKIKETGGGKIKPALDRFRVILFLRTPITDVDTFYSTWHWLYSKFPKIDKACKDAARYYYSSESILSTNWKGETIEPVAPQPKEVVSREVELTPGQKGELAKRTFKFLAMGAEVGERHAELYAAARDAHQQGYSEAWFLQEMDKLVQKTGDEAFTDDGALQTIYDAFNKDPKHPPRLGEEPQKPAFNLVRVGELYENEKPIEWLVSDLLYKGGLSIIVGDPKAGKSTVARQLIENVLRGKPFLGRNCKQGPVDYYAIEEHENVLTSSFRRLNVTNEDNLFVHVGDIFSENEFEEFQKLMLERKPTLAVVDTMFDIIKVESEYSYQEIKRELRKLRKLARETESHILLVHHTSKGGGEKRRGNRSILGSQAIAGGVDTIIVLERDGRERYITTSGREVFNWDYRSIIWDRKSGTYTLGPEEEEFF